MTEIDYAARVAKGVALLDEKWPNWATEIDVESLDIKNSRRCVTAQFAGRVLNEGFDFFTGAAALKLTLGDSGTYIALGFNAEEGDDQDDEITMPRQAAAYDTLNALWKGVIAERRAAADTDTPEGTS